MGHPVTYLRFGVIYVLIAQGTATITTTSGSHNELHFSLELEAGARKAFSRRNLEKDWLRSLPKGYCAFRVSVRWNDFVHYLLASAAGKAKELICPDDKKNTVLIWSRFKPRADYVRTCGKPVSLNLYARKRFQFAVEGNLRHTRKTEVLKCETKPPKT